MVAWAPAGLVREYVRSGPSQGVVENQAGGRAEPIMAELQRHDGLVDPEGSHEHLPSGPTALWACADCGAPEPR
jgi:hypothetical protein